MVALTGTGPSRELVLRVASAVVLIPAAIAAAALGGPVFSIFVLVIGAAVVLEWGWMTRGRPRWGPFDLAAAAGIVALAAATAFALLDHTVAACTSLLVGAGLAGALASGGVAGRGAAAASVGYAGVPALALILLRQGFEGLDAVLFLFVVVWATDIAAYVGGRLVGGPRLWPAVSPKKTWAGSIAGLLGAVLAGWVVADAGAGFGWVAWAIGLSVASQLGDLAESALKRRWGHKDSSHLIPGHGGVMDRVDGLLAAATVAALVQLALPGAALALAVVGAAS